MVMILLGIISVFYEMIESSHVGNMVSLVQVQTGLNKKALGLDLNL